MNEPTEYDECPRCDARMMQSVSETIPEGARMKQRCGACEWGERWHYSSESREWACLYRADMLGRGPLHEGDI